MVAEEAVPGGAKEQVRVNTSWERRVWQGENRLVTTRCSRLADRRRRGMRMTNNRVC